MTKTKEKVEQTLTVEFDVDKSDLKKIIKAHKRFAYPKAEGSIFQLIHFNLSGDILTIESTDGVKALLTEIGIAENFGSDFDFCLNSVLLSKITLLKDKILNTVRISKRGNFIDFINLVYETTQSFKICQSEPKYPNIKEVIPNENKMFRIGVSTVLIKDVASLTSKKGYLELFFNPKNELSPIIVKANSEVINQKAVVMPVDIYNKRGTEDA